MRLILNEKAVLDRALDDGIIEDKTTTTIRVLAKHYFSIGQNKKQVVSSIDNFMSNNYKGYIFTKWQEIIKKMVNSIYRNKNYDLLQINNINVSKKEVDTIQSIRDLNLEKLAFVLLVYAKLFNKIYGKERDWIKTNIKDILEDAAINANEVEGALMIKVLNDMGLVYPSKIVDSTDIKVLFTDSQGDVGIEVSDFENIVLYYLKYVGDEIGDCVVCGKLIELASNSQKYCKECYREKQLQWQRESWHKYKDKYRSLK